MNKILFNWKNNASQNGGIPYLLLCILITQETRIFLRVKAVTINSFELWPIYQFGHHDTRDGIQKMLGTEFSTVYEMQEQSFFFYSSLKIIKRIPHNMYCRKSLRQVFLVPCNPSSVCSKTVH